ncbi:MAG: flagella basal body P-ring formation protein FlgA [Planctomycetota bacterium]
MILELILATGTLTVDLSGRADVTGTEVRLAEIAAITGEPELVNHAGQLSLGYSPAPGFSRLLLADRIEVQLERLLPGTQVTVIGNLSCRVHPLVETIKGTHISEVAQSKIESVFRGLDAVVTVQNVIGDVKVPKGDSPATLAPVLQRRDQRPGVWSVPVQVIVDGQVYQTVWTRWEVGIWENRRVLTRAVRRGDSLTPADFKVERVRLTNSLAGDELQVAWVHGATARYDLPLGSPVAAMDIERPRIVKKGDIVHLEVRRGLITARVLVTLLDGGRLGDVVKVRAIDNEREMSATIVRKDLVQIKLK